jgi:Ca2+-binding EF-hand superfamily protein
MEEDEFDTKIEF